MEQNGYNRKCLYLTSMITDSLDNLLSASITSNFVTWEISLLYASLIARNSTGSPPYKYIFRFWSVCILVIFLLFIFDFFNKFHVLPYRDVFWVLIVETPFLWHAGLDHLDFDHLFSMLGNIRKTWRLSKAEPFFRITNYVLL